MLSFPGKRRAKRATAAFEQAHGRAVIPLGKWSKHASIRGGQATDPIAYPAGMPGVRVGQ